MAVDTLAALEQRVVRTIEMLNREREQRAEIVGEGAIDVVGQDDQVRPMVAHDGGDPFEAAIVHVAPYAIGAFVLCAVLSMLLPRTAISEQALTE